MGRVKGGGSDEAEEEWKPSPTLESQPGPTGERNNMMTAKRAGQHVVSID